MRKSAALVLLFSFFAGLTPLYAADAYEDTWWDEATDWFATLGKPQDEKDMILAERRADRAAVRLGRAFRQETKKAAKKMETFGKEMEKAFQ